MCFIKNVIFPLPLLCSLFYYFNQILSYVPHILKIGPNANHLFVLIKSTLDINSVLNTMFFAIESSKYLGYLGGLPNVGIKKSLSRMYSQGYSRLPSFSMSCIKILDLLMKFNGLKPCYYLHDNLYTIFNIALQILTKPDYSNFNKSPR